MLETEVLVVGAGPVGMLLATLLGKADVEVVVINKHTVPNVLPRAVSLDGTSARILRQAGLTEEQVRDLLIPGRGTVYYGVDRQVLFQAFGPFKNLDGYSFKNAFLQPELERTLFQKLQGQPRCRILLECTWLGAQYQSDGRMLSTVRCKDGQLETIRSRYVIGCDGANSTVRQFFQFEYKEKVFKEPWLAMDVINDPHDENVAMHFGIPCRPHVIVPYGQKQCRYEFRLFGNEYGNEIANQSHVSFALIERLLSPFRKIEPKDVVRASIYFFRSGIAKKWVKNRVILAGDAAHLMPPFAGASLNCGLLDAHDLAWRLIYILKHHYDDEFLLREYEIERKIHVKRMIRLSEFLGYTIMTTNHVFGRTRDAILRFITQVKPIYSYLAQAQFRPQPVYSKIKRRGLVGRFVPNVSVNFEGQLFSIDDLIYGKSAIVGTEEDLNRLKPRLANHSSVLLLALDENGLASGVHEITKNKGPLLLRPDGVVAAQIDRRKIEKCEWSDFAFGAAGQIGPIWWRKAFGQP